ncbi:MAG: ATP-binding protein [Alicyclobacillaceae bacterium]|nr:ATP-binding protein [Alicyclobacillaceae bacterium]
MGGSLSRRIVVLGTVAAAGASLWTGLLVARGEIRQSAEEVRRIAGREAVLAAADAEARWADRMRLAGWAERTAVLLGGECRVLGRDKSPVTSAVSPDFSAPRPEGPGEEAEQALAGAVAAEVFQAPDGRLFVRAAAPVRIGDRVEGAVWLQTPMAQVVKPFGAWWPWLIGLLSSAAAGLLWSALVARDLRNGLKMLEEAVADWARGRFRALSWSRRDELGRFASSLLDMAGALQRSSEELAVSVDKLYLEKDRLEVVLRHLVSGVMALDDRGRVELLNPAMAEFLGEERVIGRRFWGVAALYPLYAIIDRALREGVGDRYEGVFGPGGGRLVEAYVEPIHKGPGAGSGGAVIIVHDVTERRRLEQVRREFVTNVSHELKTPVTAIRGLTETLVEEELDQEEQRRFLDLIDREARRLERLVRDLLDLSRLESHSVSLNRVPVDVGLLAREVAEDYMYLAETAGSFLSAEAQGDCSAEVDPDRLRQVLSNLIDNAIKYTPSGGKIHVSVSGSDQEVKIEVSDTGIGIPPEDQERVFERFYRVDKARARSTGGTGLGLAIVKHIVQLHGGRVEVQSAPGRGSRFTVRLPKRWPPASLA